MFFRLYPNPKEKAHMIRKAIGFATGLLMLAASLSCIEDLKTPTNVEPQDWVDIRVMGTSIQRLPENVRVITGSPDEEANKLIELGGERYNWVAPDGEIHDTAVFFQRRIYAFMNPETWNQVTQGYEHEVHDVIYSFRARSTEERQKFVRKYNLTEVADVEVRGEHSVPLYRASPGYYVNIYVVVETFFTCGMHPHIRKDAPGDCPLCDMKLIPKERYK